MIYAYRNVPRTKNYNERDYELEEIMSSYWLNFVKYGNPNGKDTNGNELLKWQTTTESGGLLMEFGDTCQMVEDPFGYMYEYLEQNVIPALVKLSFPGMTGESRHHFTYLDLRVKPEDDNFQARR